MRKMENVDELFVLVVWLARERSGKRQWGRCLFPCTTLGAAVVMWQGQDSKSWTGPQNSLSHFCSLLFPMTSGIPIEKLHLSSLAHLSHSTASSGSGFMAECALSIHTICSPLSFSRKLVILEEENVFFCCYSGRGRWRPQEEDQWSWHVMTLVSFENSWGVWIRSLWISHEILAVVSGVGCTFSYGCLEFFPLVKSMYVASSIFLIRVFTFLIWDHWKGNAAMQ